MLRLRTSLLAIVIGSAFFSRSANVRKMIVVTATIEHASNGHINSPPFVKKLVTLCSASGIWAMIGCVITNLEKG